MVSKARLDLPDPERPVTTISLSRGISGDTFLRLCTRALWTPIVVRAAVLLDIARMDEGQFLDRHIASFGELNGGGDFADELAVGEVFAGCGHAADVVRASEVGLDLRSGTCFAGIP